MDVFYKLDVNTCHVVGLFSDLLPSEIRKQLKYPDKVPKFEENELQDALSKLIEYLTRVRHKLQGNITQCGNFRNFLSPIFYVKSILADFKRSKTVILTILEALNFHFFGIMYTLENVRNFNKFKIQSY